MPSSRAAWRRVAVDRGDGVCQRRRSLDTAAVGPARQGDVGEIALVQVQVRETPKAAARGSCPSRRLASAPSELGRTASWPARNTKGEVASYLPPAPRATRATRASSVTHREANNTLSEEGDAEKATREGDELRDWRAGPANRPPFPVAHAGSSPTNLLREGEHAWPARQRLLVT
ncbi:hypothetical protein THAOC_26354 [Thalassiosira oceanica]|uniref:Uncharacterized protein n=1 Tax=Thalassiosira oceanica TaxID=159749 RepID=K0RK31_THAOC|nr:hypothetical protein THAOC_26354 [Thalassiosira oceanica]|eukprot:EJK54088.1 hypothetical protein THAOC_26354 [Thalassiosira oceanica]